MKYEKRLEICLVAVALGVLILLGFLAQRAVPFMMDDIWYGTNLATGEPLHNLSDIIEGQIWHFHNWGGRSVTHSVLQLTLMCGEFWADVLNLLFVLLLTYLVCVVAGKKDLLTFLLVHSLIYALNPNVKMSMLWQAGTANYVFSSVWILVYMLPFFRMIQDPKAKIRLPGAALWMLPLGLMAGWSNENMGPCCFLLALSTCVYVKKFCKQKIHLWMINGMLSSLLGSILVVAAPGNFVRSSAIQQPTLYERFFGMLEAGVGFLFPTAVLTMVLALIYGVVEHKSWNRLQCVLPILAVLSYGAMVLSPHYPDRATFGTMILCIALSANLMNEINVAQCDSKEKQSAENGLAQNMSYRWSNKVMYAIVACFWLCAVIKLLAEIAIV